MLQCEKHYVNKVWDFNLDFFWHLLFWFIFQDVEKKEPPLYARNIWIPILLIERDRYVKFFILDMEKLFKKKG
jgi:hypothetical protein